MGSKPAEILWTHLMKLLESRHDLATGEAPVRRHQGQRSRRRMTAKGGVYLSRLANPRIGRTRVSRSVTPGSA